MKQEKNINLYEFARNYMPGGVSSSIRMCRSLGYPLYIQRGEGSKVYDVDGNEYIDLHMSHGATILGHNNSKIKAAIQKALHMGIICSYETEYHSQVAKKISELVPCAEMVRFVCSGTESTMHVIRLAREFTGREVILKFEGHFHGYHDYLMYSYSPPVEKAGSPDSPIPYVQSGGVPRQISDLLIVVPFNNLAAFEKAVKKHKDRLAAVIMEPINYNAGCIVPTREYANAIREITKNNDILLIYDEVLSAFRTGPGGGQEYLGVTPDLCTIGKSVAGGTPLSVFAGKREIMEHLQPLGNCQHSGTYNGHLIPIMAAQACLEEISSAGFYDHIYKLADQLYSGLDMIFRDTGVPGRVQGLGSRFGIYFGIEEEVTNYRIAAKSDDELGRKFFSAALRHGVLFCDSWGKASHHGYSAAHTETDIEQVLERIEAAMKDVKKTL